jgi:glucosamine 6-phosphate synthetase-like amidotransferase/phosphosugar isomerase protein
MCGIAGYVGRKEAAPLLIEGLRRLEDRGAKARGARTPAIVNVVGSTMARESDAGIYTRAGPEIGVASRLIDPTQPRRRCAASRARRRLP